MSFDAAVALVIIVVLFGTLAALIWWARGTSPYDDGMGARSVDYVPEPPDPALLPGQDAPDGTTGRGVGAQSPGRRERGRAGPKDAAEGRPSTGEHPPGDHTPGVPPTD